MSIDDWRYSDHKMKVRDKHFTVLLSRYGGEIEKRGNLNTPVNQSTSVLTIGSLNNVNCNGITAYYEAYYAKVILMY